MTNGSNRIVIPAVIKTPYFGNGAFLLEVMAPPVVIPATWGNLLSSVSGGGQIHRRTLGICSFAVSARSMSPQVVGKVHDASSVVAASEPKNGQSQLTFAR